MSDLIDASDERLRELCLRAFILGLVDGRGRGAPRSGEEIMHSLTMAQETWKVFHRQKFRQIYGAAFDIGRLTEQVKMVRMIQETNEIVGVPKA